MSKKRGKSKSHNGPQGFNPHSICILAAVDENDHMILKVAGIGRESRDKLDRFRSFFRRNSTIICDDRQSIVNFARDHYMNRDIIPSLKGKKRYRTDRGNSLSSVNQLHQEIEILKYRKKRYFHQTSSGLS